MSQIPVSTSASINTYTTTSNMAAQNLVVTPIWRPTASTPGTIPKRSGAYTPPKVIARQSSSIRHAREENLAYSHLSAQKDGFSVGVCRLEHCTCLSDSERQTIRCSIASAKYVLFATETYCSGSGYITVQHASKENSTLSFEAHLFLHSTGKLQRSKER